MFSFIKMLFTKQKQGITGNNNTAVIAGRDINIHHGVPQKVVDRLEELLQEKDIKLQDREGVIASWIQKYKELESQLASQTDDIAKQAKSFLDDGNLVRSPDGAACGVIRVLWSATSRIAPQAAPSGLRHCLV